MRILVTVLAASILAAFARPETAKAQSSVVQQAQCELAAIRDTRSAVAVQFIRSACNWLALNGDSLLNARNKGYYVCLLQNLSGVQSDAAAQAVVSACRASNRL